MKRYKRINILYRRSSWGNTPDPNELYVNLFNDLSDLTINETSPNNVSVSTPIGTVLPNVSNALTIEHTVAGVNTVGIQLPSVEEELYIQFYGSVIKYAGATSYTDFFKVGAAIGSLQACQIDQSHILNFYRPYSRPTFVNIANRYGREGVWYKYGIHIDKIAGTARYYMDGRFSHEINITDRDLEYITFGGTGDNVQGYKLQFAALSVNTNNFQDIITNNNGVGEYTTHHVDYSMETETAYFDPSQGQTIADAVDLTTLDRSGWSGMHSKPFDPDGGTNYIDGAVPYLSDIGTSNIYTKSYDMFAFKRGVTHKLRSITDRPNINNGADTYTENNSPKVSAYGSGSLPKVDLSALVDPSDWVVHDAVNNIYKITLPSVGNLVGVVVNNGELFLRRDFNNTRITTTSGTWALDGLDVLVRMWDDSDPSLTDVSLCTNLDFSLNNFGQVENIHWRHGRANSAPFGDMFNCEFSHGAGSDINNTKFRDNYIHDLWSGTDYGDTEATNPSFGLGGNGVEGFRVYENAKIYRNRFYDGYLGLNIFQNAHDAIIAFNEFKNSVSNTLSLAGTSSDGIVGREIIIGNNTFFGGGRHINNDPYPLVRDQPHHSFVHQSGGSAVFKFFNNIMMIHFNSNLGSQSVCNSMSFVEGILPTAIGKIGYNVYHKTALSGSPCVIFNQGADDIAAWRTAMAGSGSFTDMDGSSDPDTTSVVEVSLPVTQGVHSATSGKWNTTNGTPLSTGGGYTGFDYGSVGITEDLSGNSTTEGTLNKGAR